MTEVHFYPRPGRHPARESRQALLLVLLVCLCNRLKELFSLLPAPANRAKADAKVTTSRQTRKLFSDYFATNAKIFPHC